MFLCAPENPHFYTSMPAHRTAKQYTTIISTQIILTVITEVCRKFKASIVTGIQNTGFQATEIISSSQV